MLLIGSHVSYKNETQLLGSVKEALSYKSNCFMFYTGAPQNTQRGKIDDELTYRAYELMKENGIDLENIICHAPYIVNLANDLDSEKYEFAINFLTNELRRCNQLGIKYLVLHPGSHMKIEKNHAIYNIVKGLNIALSTSSNTVVLLETMAGKGTELGTNICELKEIINNVDDKNRIGVCLDTCHLNDSGIDISYFDEYLNEFDKEIGIDKIKCVHVNDSKNPLGSHKDRHENIGYGTIGFDSLIGVIYNKKLENVPKILETPYVNREYSPYNQEIEMIRSKTFNPNLYQDILDYYRK